MPVLQQRRQRGSQDPLSELVAEALERIRVDAEDTWL